MSNIDRPEENTCGSSIFMAGLAVRSQSELINLLFKIKMASAMLPGCLICLCLLRFFLYPSLP